MNNDHKATWSIKERCEDMVGSKLPYLSRFVFNHLNSSVEMKNVYEHINKELSPMGFEVILTTDSIIFTLGKAESFLEYHG